MICCSIFFGQNLLFSVWVDKPLFCAEFVGIEKKKQTHLRFRESNSICSCNVLFQFRFFSFSFSHFFFCGRIKKCKVRVEIQTNLFHFWNNQKLHMTYSHLLRFFFLMYVVHIIRSFFCPLSCLSFWFIFFISVLAINCVWISSMTFCDNCTSGSYYNVASITSLRLHVIWDFFIHNTNTF